MKIAIDCSDINEEKAGIGMYTYGLVHALAKQLNVDLVLYGYSEELLEEFNLYSNISIVIKKAYSGNIKWMFQVSQDLKNREYDYFLSPSRFFFSALIPNTIQIIHDIFPLEYPNNWSVISRLKYRIYLHLATYRARFFATNSENTKKRFTNKYPYTNSKTFSIGTGLSPWVYSKKTDQNIIKEVKEKYQIKKSYFVSIGTLEPRKNYVNAIKGFAEFLKDNPGYVYVIIGKTGWYYEEIFELIEKEGLDKNIIFTGYTKEEDVTALVDGSKGLVALSFDEGAGMPPLEALARSKNVMVSDIDVHREFLENNALYVNPNFIESIKDGFLNISQKQEREVKAEFLENLSWDKVAKRLVEFLTFPGK